MPPQSAKQRSPAPDTHRERPGGQPLPRPRQAQPGAQLHCGALRRACAVPHRGPGGEEQGEGWAVACGHLSETRCCVIAAFIWKLLSSPLSLLNILCLRSLLVRHDLTRNDTHVSVGLLLLGLQWTSLGLLGLRPCSSGAWVSRAGHPWTAVGSTSPALTCSSCPFPHRTPFPRS